MGRYYSGDINGKFWFALQSSDAASRFGGQSYSPDYITYSFSDEDLKGVEREINDILNKLGNKKEILEDFFSKNASYTDKNIEDLGVSRDDLSDYADLGLGIKIRDCIKENGSCIFDAEL